jgi:hypothetical protein
MSFLRPHQTCFHFFAFFITYQGFNRGECEIHGGAWIARGDNFSIFYDDVSADSGVVGIEFFQRAGIGSGTLAIEQAGAGKYFGSGTDGGDIFFIFQVCVLNDRFGVGCSADFQGGRLQIKGLIAKN